MKLGEKVYTYNTIRKNVLESTTEVRVGYIVSKKKGIPPFTQTEYIVSDNHGLHVHNRETVYKYDDRFALGED